MNYKINVEMEIMVHDMWFNFITKILEGILGSNSVHLSRLTELKRKCLGSFVGNFRGKLGV